MTKSIGHTRIGNGPIRVIITNDWLGDTTTWNQCQQYLDTTDISWVFADLRGYGGSRYMPGPFNATQAASDIVALADQLGWERFVTVGHSMSTIVSLHLAQQQPDRIDRAILITPPPPQGGAPEEVLSGAKEIAMGDDALRKEALKQMWGTRLPDAWIAYKVNRWREAAEPHAVAAYVDMFARDGLPDRERRIYRPVIAIAGADDPNPLMRSALVSSALRPICTRLRVQSLEQSGHYPMQELPPLFAKVVQEAVTGAPPV